ncbi:hypothetical protein [Streptomyces catenulae]|uniref:Uncharacterized protein n=1 Tax=Streptomyces catenulae TaxID=66875 RepID=A0ABV2Z1V2_9ACTN
MPADPTSPATTPDGHRPAPYGPTPDTAPTTGHPRPRPTEAAA